MSNSFALQIQGIGTVFTEGAEAGFSGYVQSKSITGLKASSSKLDLARRRTKGEGLDVDLRDISGEIRALVQQRSGAATTLGGATGGFYIIGPTTVTVGSTSAFLDDGTFYCGSETFTYTGKTATTFTGVIGSNFGSGSQLHFKDDGVFVAPPAWTGRKATLYHNSVQIGVYRMAQPPQYLGGEQWELSMTAISDWYAALKVLDGIVQVQSDEEKGIGSPTEMETTEHVRALGNKNTDMHILFKMGTGAAYIGQVASGGTATEIEHIDSRMISPSFREYEEFIAPGIGAVAQWESAQIAIRVMGDAANEATKLLNSGYPSSDPSAFDEGGWDMSAGLSVDLSALVGRAQWAQVLTETMTVEDVLYELCLATGSYWYADSTGSIVVVPLRERIPPSAVVAAITDANTLVSTAESLNISEDEVYHRVTLNCDWDPLSDQYLTVVNVLDGTVKRLFEDSSAALELSSKFIRSDVTSWGGQGPQGQTIRAGANMSRDEIEGMLRRIQRYSILPRADYTCTVTFDLAQVRPGEVVSVVNERVPDLKGGSLSSQFIVLERRARYEKGEIELTLRLVEAGYLFCVAIEVGVVAGATITPAANDYWTDLDSLGVGWTVIAPERSGASRTIASKGATTFDLSSSIAGLVAGDILIVKSGVATNDDGFVPSDYTFQDVATRWS